MRSGNLFQTPLGLVLVLVVIICALIVITRNSGSWEELRMGICERWNSLSICKEAGSVYITKEYNQAKLSVQALACAVNSVAAGKEDACVKALKSEADANKFDTAVSCTGSGGSQRCTVANFALPQYDAEKGFIAGQGDPRFLAYWNAFPQMIEDSWSGFTPFADAPINTIIGYKIVARILPIGKTGRMLFPIMARYAVILTEAEAMGPASRAIGSLMEPHLSDTSKAILKGMGSGITLLAKFIESTKAKYIPVGNAIALKSPYQQPEVFQLQTDAPVLFEGSGSKYPFISYAPTFFSVAPCKANIVARASAARCDTFSYNTDQKSSICLEPSEVSGIGQRRCSATTFSKQGIAFIDGDYMPERLQDLFGSKSKDDAMIYYETDSGSFEAMDPVTRMSFIFETRGGSLKLTRLMMIYGDERKAYPLDESGAYKSDDIDISFAVSCKWTGSPESMDTSSPPYLTCDLSGAASANLKNAVCMPCAELAKHLKNIESWQFGRSKLIVEDQEAKKLTSWMNILKYVYKDNSGRYQLKFEDANKDGSTETVSVKNLGSAGAGTGWLVKPDMMISDTPSLETGLFDKRFDTYTIFGCDTNAVFVSMDRVKTDKPNFCYPQKDMWIKRAARWSPEIGAAVGAVVGMKYGGPWGALPGAATGYRAGIVALGAFEIAEYVGWIDPDPWVWPGQAY